MFKLSPCSCSCFPLPIIRSAPLAVLFLHSCPFVFLPRPWRLSSTRTSPEALENLLRRVPAAPAGLVPAAGTADRCAAGVHGALAQHPLVRSSDAVRERAGGGPRRGYGGAAGGIVTQELHPEEPLPSVRRKSYNATRVTS